MESNITSIEKNFNIALCLLMNKDFDANTINYYTMLSNKPEVYRNKMFKYLETSTNNNKEAIRLLNYVLKNKPHCTISFNYRGIAKFNLFDNEGAIEDFDRAIELDPYYTIAYNNRGNAFSKLKKFDSAITDYNKAINLNHSSAEVYKNRGTAKKNKKDSLGACEDFTKATELEPKYSLHNKTREYSD